MKFSELTQIALLGTERQAITVTSSRTALGQLESQVDITRREHALLTLAAMATLHETIGSQPDRDNAPLPELCPAENQLLVSGQANSLLLRLLVGDFAELLPEWLGHATTANQLAWPEALPALLQLGSSKPDFQQLVLPVLGQRGRWLAAQNEEWRWSAGTRVDDETVWETGEPAVRLLFLQGLRKTDAARALELLQLSWTQETPEDRAALLGVMQIGLSPDDEDFLEAALDDKRKEVRKKAAAIVVRLENSKLVKRMEVRARPLLEFVQGGDAKVAKKKKRKPPSIEVTLPAECDKAMQRDGIEPKPPQGIGEKAWWLIQMLAAVPLNLWTQEWQVTPETIILASQNSEWSKELFEGWVLAATTQANTAWAEPLFDAAIDMERFDKLGGLLAAMSARQRELRLTPLLLQPKNDTRALTGILISDYRGPWSPEFSRAVLGYMRRETAHDSGDWQLRSQLRLFALRVAPEVLKEAAIGWPTDSPGWEFWSKGVDDFIAVAQFRDDVQTVFQPQP